MDRFVIDHEGIVLDTKTGLEWQANHSGPMTWYEAVALAGGLGEGWRLPTIEELESLVDRTRNDPASSFPTMPLRYFWSSSSYAGASSYAWYVSFVGGVVNAGGKSFTSYVRCVRGESK